MGSPVRSWKCRSAGTGLALALFLHPRLPGGRQRLGVEAEKHYERRRRPNRTGVSHWPRVKPGGAGAVGQRHARQPAVEGLDITAESLRAWCTALCCGTRGSTGFLVGLFQLAESLQAALVVALANGDYGFIGRIRKQQPVEQLEIDGSGAAEV
jgi:hypothetical protein